MNTRLLFLLLSSLLLSACQSAVSTVSAVSELSNESATKVSATTSKMAQDIPRTDKAFLNDQDNFQFVIVGDRTGGHRPGIFKSAIAKVNSLQPEFVVSVGDLIEGYTEDRAKLAKEWDEFDQMVNDLDMPFFYTVGNHDMGNATMQDVWRSRMGRDYYYYIYKNVLFLSLNTEDPPVELSEEIRAKQAMLEKMMAEDPEATQQRILDSSRQRSKPVKLPGQVAISDDQIEYFKQVLADHADVRWTVLLMHKPAWLYQSEQFARIETLLRDRDYTVIAGHEHYLTAERRNGRDYIDMGTTGGVWLQDGPGRLDHVMWVTMTDTGPKFSSIRLDGLEEIKTNSDEE